MDTFLLLSILLLIFVYLLRNILVNKWSKRIAEKYWKIKEELKKLKDATNYDNRNN